ncbi:hypothetical protein AAFF_G00341440 [Aldrovandia affinis]|uniref:Deleted in malignant brain tumors 1 protein-like n=1 Tax=Aldrovandia affinis TaxID=143900 RepID=A0AAD7SKN3_9TELE|nr:hypothetical protein AAFF_G00341440 [Aldrovandia affinis]
MLGMRLMAFVHILGMGSQADGARIRLANGSGRCSGRVEVYHSGEWGTVCDNSWDMKDATVVCRELGCGSAVSVHRDAHFGQGSEPTWMDDVVCTGNETSLIQCKHRGFGTEDCTHAEDAGVTCSYQIRLVNGTGRCSGRVEVYHSGKWGTVCDDFWDMKDAAVVCRELGCGSALYAHVKAHFGQGSEPTWLDDVACRGSECSLAQCKHPGFGNEDCTHAEDAGVTCSGNVEQPTLSQKSSYSLFSPGEEVQFRCAGVCSPIEFHLHKSGVGTPLAQVYQSSGTSAVMTVSNMDASHQGSYSCTYRIQGSRSAISSPHSNSLDITVVVLLQPNISLSDPAEAVTWGPQGPEVIRGHSFTITCSTAPQYPGGFFHLTIPGSNMTETAVNHYASFIFPAAEFSHQGNYSCVYSTTVSTRNFSSPGSESLPLIVRASLVLPVIIAVSAGLLLSVLLALIIFLVFRHRRRNQGRAQKKVSNAYATKAYSTRGETNEEEEEEEQDYVNVESFCANAFEEVEEDEDSTCSTDTNHNKRQNNVVI